MKQPRVGSSVAKSLVVGFLLTAGCGGSKADTKEETPPTPATAEKWEGCEDILDSLETDVITISEASYTGEKQVWGFDFHGLSTRIPQRDWEVLPDVTDESVSLLLTSPDARMLFIADPPSEPMEDVFQKAGLKPTMEGRARTKEMFGEAPTLHELVVKGYQHRPEELTCDAKNADAELPIAVALVLARTSAPGELLAVHFDTRSQGELTFFRKKGDGDELWYEVEVWVPTEEHWFIVNFQSRDRAEAEAMAATGPVGPTDLAASPAWVKALSKAVGYPNDANTWSALLEALKNRGASDKSLDRIKKLAEAGTTVL